MASIYDFGNPPPPQVEPEGKPRSKKRELTAMEVRTGKTTLLGMVDKAFETLQAAMTEADWPTAIKAAQVILDRTGFGPKTTVDVNSTHVDLSMLSREQLAERAMLISRKFALPHPPQEDPDNPPPPVTIN
jgi:hypothetical protein